MNKDESGFSPQQSLEVIRSMIETTKTSISDSSHFFLLWGWATLIGCLVQYYLLVVAKSPHHYYAWLITPIALILHIIFLYKYKRRERVKTFIGEANRYVWMVIGFSYFTLSFIFVRIGWQYSFPFYILLYGIGTFISGNLLKFKPMAVGGMACLALAALTPYLEYSFQILVSALAILISYIIPGHLLRNQYKKTNNNLTHGTRRATT